MARDASGARRRRSGLGLRAPARAEVRQHPQRRRGGISQRGSGATNQRGSAAMRKRFLQLAVILGLAAIALWWLQPEDRQGGEAPAPAYQPATDSIERGRELVTLADCGSCHTARGGAPFAGGHAIPTPFGTF